MQSAPPRLAVELANLTKSFDRPAVDGLNLAVRVGEFYSLLGPNGAGKTTTLRMIAGLLRPDAGSISVLGIDAGIAEKSAHGLLDWLGLAPHAHKRCEGFSKGMRQKVALAGALVHDPRVIILDEPLTGLDAGSARQVKGVLRERVDSGGVVIMTTHILEVAERMADRIGVIAHGRLIAEGTLEDLRAQTGKRGTSLEDTFLTLLAEQDAA
jgi:ABC-2 type transport system ATP-binding protein